MKKVGLILAVSRVYPSAAEGPAGQPDFVNTAVLVETALTPAELRERLRQIESELGRVRVANKYAPRPIDLDLVFYDEVIQEGPQVRLPDPDLLVRPPLAVTVAELDPRARHPVTGVPLTELARRLADGARLIPRPDVVLEAGAAGEHREA